jgi:transposase
MLSTHSSARKRSTRHPFLVGLWDEHHPDFQRIDSELERDHHARWLQAAVARLDLESLRRAYSNCGSLAYPVEQLLAFVLWMYSKKLTSPASWVEESRKNDAGKWLLLGLQPSRSTFYTFRDRVEPFLDSFHKTFIDWAKAESITSAQRGSLDGSFVAALASRHRLLSSQTVDARVLLLLLAVAVDKRIDEGLGRLVLVLVASGLLVEPIALLLLLLIVVLLLEHREAARRGELPAWLPTTVAGRARLLKRLEKAQQRQHERRKPLEGKKRLSKKDKKTLRVKINPSDPEAALGFDKRGTYRPLYNLQLVKATDANLILAWELYSRNNDDGLLKPMMEQMHQQTGQHLEEVLVDGAFVSIIDLIYCEKHSITVYAPPAKPAQAKPDSAAPLLAASASEKDSSPAQSSSGSVSVESAAEPSPSEQPPEVAQPSKATLEQKVESEGAANSSGKKPVEVKKYGKEKFVYNPEKKEYQCPAEKVLKEVFRTKVKRGGGVELPVLVHRAEASDCQSCPQRSQCTTGKQGRVVKRYEGEEALERLEARMAQPANQEIYRLRSQTVEPGYGELKTHRGLNEFRCFGKKRSRCQAGLTILANNALSIVRALRRRDSASKPPPSDDFQAA